jgi:hypothetical protein
MSNQTGVAVATLCSHVNTTAESPPGTLVHWYTMSNQSGDAVTTLYRPVNATVEGPPYTHWYTMSNQSGNAVAVATLHSPVNTTAERAPGIRVQYEQLVRERGGGAAATLYRPLEDPVVYILPTW